jgi:hypothetical protein|tara:strand:- start:105 stop:329 length:225 start_codon:yes stop_codon:yes gene_type:complete
MSKRILYKQDNGTISIIVPTADALQIMSIEEIARKDVPTGKAYKIVNASEISSDRTFRDAWTILDSELTDGVGD